MHVPDEIVTLFQGAIFPPPSVNTSGRLPLQVILVFLRNPDNLQIVIFMIDFWVLSLGLRLEPGVYDKQSPGVHLLQG